MTESLPERLGLRAKAKPLPSAGIPFMVTNAMKAKLQDLGFTPEQINGMTPTQAHAHLSASAWPSPPPPAPAAPAAKAVAGISAAELQQKVFAPVQWTAKPYITPGLTLLASKPKKGKSWWVLDLCLAVSSDSATFLGNPVDHGDCLYLALEDNERRLKERSAKLVGPVGQWPARLRFEMDWPRGDEAVAKIRQWLEAHPGAKLVVVDVLTKVRPLVAAKGQTAYEADYHALAALQKLASEFGIAVVVVHHTRKSGAAEGGDVFDVMSGTLGLNGCADTLLIFHQDAQGMTLHCRGRDVEELAHAVEFDRATCRWKILGEADEVHKSAQRKTIVAALRDAAAGEAMGPTDIAAACDMQVENARKLLFKMVKDGEVRKTGRGKYRYIVPVVPVGAQPTVNTTEPTGPATVPVGSGPIRLGLPPLPLPPPPMPQRH